ncbi:hypothetical protein HR11_10520 [Porphyromonas macacae]|nr:hypothetical protein HR11_10520 [Porphyromonas macacae]
MALSSRQNRSRPIENFSRKVLLTQHVKLSKACTGKIFAKPQVLTVEDDARIQDIRFVQGPFVEMAFIESLTAEAKQFAERGNGMSTPGF